MIRTRKHSTYEDQVSGDQVSASALSGPLIFTMMYQERRGSLLKIERLQVGASSLALRCVLDPDTLVPA